MAKIWVFYAILKYTRSLICVCAFSYLFLQISIQFSLIHFTLTLGPIHHMLVDFSLNLIP